MPTFTFETFPTLETERLILRRIVRADADAWLAVHDHPEVMRYLIDFDTPTTDLAEINEIIDWADGIFKNKTGIRWAITLKPDNTMIGSCGFHVYSAHHRWAEIGYELHHAYWRRGIMQEAVTEVMRFCTDELHLHRIEANATEGNEASRGLLLKLGFGQEGTWRDRVYSRGRFHSLWQFGKLVGE